MRIPRRNMPSRRSPSQEFSSFSSGGGVDRKVKILSIVVGVQSVLLIVLFILQLTSGGGGNQKSPATILSGESDALTDQSTEIAEEAVVDTRETGELPPEVAPSRPIRIEILNGCGVPKLASRFANALRSEGYDIRDTRNANRSNYTNSFIYDRSSLPGQARRMATILGISQQRVINQSDDNLVDIDLTLILGADYTLLNVSP